MYQIDVNVHKSELPFQILKEKLVTSGTLQGFESLQRYSGRAGDKLQQSGSPLLIVRLHGPPEPLHDVTVRCAVLQTGVWLPVIDIDLPQSTHNKLKVRETLEPCSLLWLAMAIMKDWCFHTSNSFSSNALSRCCGMTSLNPFCRARNWASMPLRNRQFTYSLCKNRHETLQLCRDTLEREEEGAEGPHAYLTYSFLVSWVTGMLLPLGFSSCWMISPYALCSTQNVWSNTPVMSLSLNAHREEKRFIVILLIMYAL